MVPTLRGAAARKRLRNRFGLPNAAPTETELQAGWSLELFASCRVLFVDDDRGGEPVAYWEPER